MPRTYSITFQPGDEIVHVIAKNFNPVNRAEFNPGVENASKTRQEVIASSRRWGMSLFERMSEYALKFNTKLPLKFKKDIDIV